MPEDHSDLALEKLSEQAQASYDWYLPANNVSVPSTSDKQIITLDLAKDLPEHLVSLSNYIANEIPALDSSTIQWTKRDEGLWGWTLSICVLQGRGRGGLRVACSDIKDWCVSNIKPASFSIHDLPDPRDKEGNSSPLDLDWVLIDCGDEFVGHIFGSIHSRDEQFALPNSERWRAECHADWERDHRWVQWLEDTKKFSTMNVRSPKKKVTRRRQVPRS